MSTNPYASPEIPSDPSAVLAKRGFPFLKLLIVLGIVLTLAALLLPATRRAGPAARRMQCKNNLKQIALALHNYEAEHGVLPPAYTTDAAGKPLHSWRTLILPYLDRDQLYSRIDLTKPWDDPANLEALKTGVATYRCPSAGLPEFHTAYLAVVAASGCFRPGEPRLFADITDSRGETLMVIEVPSEHAVHWMSPVDADEHLVMAFTRGGDLPHTGGIQAAFVDGSIRFLSSRIDAETLRALISVAGSETIGEF